MFCKCKHASSKRSSDTARGRVAFQQKAGLAQHKNQQRGGLSRARRALPSLTTSGDAAVWGAGQRRRRSPATGTSASQGASGKGAGAERCPMGGPTAQSSDAHGLGPTWPHTVISTVQDSQGAADTLGLSVRGRHDTGDDPPHAKRDKIKVSVSRQKLSYMQIKKFTKMEDYKASSSRKPQFLETEGIRTGRGSPPAAPRH